VEQVEQWGTPLYLLAQTLFHLTFSKVEQVEQFEKMNGNVPPVPLRFF
jgi:hypothetical protein